MVETVSLVANCVLSLSLLCYIIYRESRHDKERAQLIDRLMAKNLTEYKWMNPAPSQRKSVTFEKPMTDQEMYWKEQKELKEKAEKNFQEKLNAAS